MTGNALPRIFSPARRLALRRRARRLRQSPDAPAFLIEDMVEDVLDRLAFLRVEPRRVLIVSDEGDAMAAPLRARDAQVTLAAPVDGFDEEQPYPFEGFDLIVSLGTLDTLNDLPGALVHMRRALTPGGLMIASFLAAGSVPMLRDAMLVADGERPAARLHPTVDVRSGGQLLQRTLFADPVIDHRAVNVSYRTLPALVRDLRAMGASAVLADPGPALDKHAYARACTAFQRAGHDGRTTETFELVTLSGWKPKTPGT